MKLDCGKVLVDLDGNDLVDRVFGANTKEFEEVSVTIGKVLANALNAPAREKEPVSGETQGRIYDLMRKVYLGTEIDVTIKDIEIMSKKVSENFPPLISGQIINIFNE